MSISNEIQQSQNEMLNAARKERKRVEIYVVNGVRLVGHIESFDQYLVMLRTHTGIQAVYKHAITAIQPDTGRRAPSARSAPKPAPGARENATVVVTRKRRRGRPCNPSTRINRITRCRPTRWPFACKAACTRGLP